MTYLLDANIFIEAKNRYYGLDFCPAFWNWILEKNQTGLVQSIDKVADEIAPGDDSLSEWAKERARHIFRNTDTSVLSQLGRVSLWATSQNYEPGAISTFYESADYYLIGHAMAQSSAIVTHEVPSTSTKRIKIPNVCAGLGISFLNPFEMLRRERANFVLGGTV
ncbi:uncharacterized protein DUF4411 [Leptospira meyeri]|uniref:Uncharacterized protein DUF4411 n=1 Tax=Leptospira meyeri TaxID=29508 RepID=A0A4R8MQM7_LEPME|nr:DUF4411 family protein [Leptospira meyeri]EKJ87676.1 PF14367 domain protein [Leptospira meyeri serovar Hardjo str. Went 5]TDY67163.1 uncharacterized protein DUF4411 [Leptospira meyeri]